MEYVEKIRDLVSSFAHHGLEAMGELNAKQADLDLESIFIPETLVSKSGRSSSLKKLEQLQALLERHKALYSSYNLNLSARAINIINELPEELRKIEMQSFAVTQQQRLDEQAYFFSLRQSWIDKTVALVEFIEDSSETMEYDGEQLLFQTDEEVQKLEELRLAIDEIAQSENDLFIAKMKAVERSYSVINSGKPI